MNFRRFETFVIICIIGLIGVVYALTQKPQTPRVNQNLEQSQAEQQNLQQQPIQQVPVTYIQYQGQDGQTALDLLKALHRVETKEYSGLGQFVTSIDGVEGDAVNSFWAFYIDGSLGQTAADKTQTKNGQNIEWKLEAISN